MTTQIRAVPSGKKKARPIRSARSWDKKQFRDLVLKGVNEMLEADSWGIAQVVIAIVYHAKEDVVITVREELIPLASKLYRGTCHGTCSKKIKNPHPSELFRCQKCGEVEAKYNELSAKIPKGHTLETDLCNALWAWKNGKKPSSIDRATSIELMKVDAWPWEDFPFRLVKGGCGT